ncbi:MAG TPA: bifunctional hydroxymethylpyrimidine kinase/phosphomethylpyrimidine kinase [Dongiaceae bacterium]|nr:bifunctional hydroxymethylpyrimidine kinase/phosphomethylpyrimidine kinase [Dongiaceae bacterium]
MSKRVQLPIALTVAGSDSGGGAGIQADLKTFASLGVHGASVITCVTAQNPRRVSAVQTCGAEMVRGQLEAVFDELPPRAVKTGMLYSAPVIRAVAAFLASRRGPVLVVDPVLVSTSGAPLLKANAVASLVEELLPLAGLVTPNRDEAELLTGLRLNSPQELRDAARALHERFGCAVLVKGGHLRRLREAVDVFYDGREELLLSAPFVRGIRTHGTGCVYSAAIAAYLARGLSLGRAVCRAKEYITQAIARSCVAAGHPVLNSFWTTDCSLHQARVIL